MRRFVMAGMVLLALAGGGCGFAKGFRDEGLRQVGDLAVDELDRKLDGKLDGVKDAINGFKDAIPKKDPAGDGLLYTIGGLAAYIIGSIGKGKIREMREKKEDNT